MFELLGYVVLGYLLYKLISAWVVLQEIKHAVGEAVDRKVLSDAMINQIKLVRFEKVVQGDYRVVLAYDNDNKFLGQAATQEEVEAMLKQKFPNLGIITVQDTVDTKPI